MSDFSHIICPSCGADIDVQNRLSQQLEEEIKKKYQNQFGTEQKKLREERELLLKSQEEFNQKKKIENRMFQERMDKQLVEERKTLEENIKAKITADTEAQVQALEKALAEKSEGVRELNRTKTENEILKREKLELKESIEAESQKKLNELLLLEKEKIKKSEEDRNELFIKELQKQLEDQKKLTDEMKRKQSQGSMQLQGEVQELAIEEWLTSQFPLDSVEEIKKGARGGDCIHVVNTRDFQNCGKIYYESKRTKEFQTSWIEKFKNDMRERNATIGVLVTEAMPPDLKRMGMKDGIWICSYDEFKGLCAVLRHTVIQLSMATQSQENKGDKMSMVYDFLTSNAFRMHVESMVEGFSALTVGLDNEKRAMQRIWKEREKQIEKVSTNTIEMYGSIRGIVGKAIQAVDLLELSHGPALIDTGVDIEAN